MSTPENPTEIWEWFAAATLHDLGKTVIDANGSWQQKALDPSKSPAIKPGEIDFDALR